jgi:hypothetical protein
MSVGKRYVRFRLLGVVIPLVAGGVLIAAKVLAGPGQLHVLTASQAQLHVLVDGKPTDVVAASTSHGRFEVPRGAHTFELALGPLKRTYQVKVNGLSNLLLPLEGQCFIWVVAPPGHRSVQIAKRYPDERAVIELPEEAILGAENLPKEPPPAGVSLVELVDCARLKDSDDALINAL